MNLVAYVDYYKQQGFDLISIQRNRARTPIYQSGHQVMLVPGTNSTATVTAYVDGHILETLIEAQGKRTLLTYETMKSMNNMAVSHITLKSIMHVRFGDRNSDGLYTCTIECEDMEVRFNESN